jgi:hypothetical protein
MFVIKSSNCGLHAWHNNKSLTVGNPNNIMNHIIENRNKWSLLSTLQLNILACMLSVVALSRWIYKVLWPDQNCITSRRWFHQNFLSLATLDWKFGLFRIWQNVINIYLSANLSFFREALTILPCKQKLMMRSSLWDIRWYEFKPVEPILILSRLLFFILLLLRRLFQ